MRKIYVYSALLSLILTAAGCDPVNNKKEMNSGAQTDTIPVLMEYKDTVGNWPLTASMKGGLPFTDNPQLKKIMNEWINERLGGTFVITDPLNTDSILSYYLHTWADSSASAIREFDMPDYHSEYCWENSFKVEAQTDKYVSLSLSSYSFQGGAHGASFIQQQTFRKEDGREFGWNNMFTEGRKYELREMLKNGVMKYFQANTENELSNFLLDQDNAYMFPLPETPPVMLKDGMRFVYQQYELTPYAFGMPEVILPYSKVEPLLTSSARQLLK